MSNEIGEGNSMVDLRPRVGKQAEQTRIYTQFPLESEQEESVNSTLLKGNFVYKYHCGNCFRY